MSGEMERLSTEVIQEAVREAMPSLPRPTAHIRAHRTSFHPLKRLVDDHSSHASRLPSNDLDEFSAAAIR
jgi:hypothetical protein